MHWSFNQQNTGPVRKNHRSKKQGTTSSRSAHATYPVRASWELSIFSFLGREEGKKTLHACNLKCENERKERALFESLEIWVEVTCHSKTRLHEYQDGGCFGVEGRWHLRPDSEAVNGANKLYKMSLAAADKLLKIFDALKNFREGIPVTDPNPLAKWGFLHLNNCTHHYKMHI